MKIVMSAILALFLIGCGDDSKKETQTTEAKVPVASEVKAEVAEVPKTAETPVEEAVKDESLKAQEYAKTSVEEVAKEAQEVVTPVVAEVKEEVVEKVEEVATPVVAATTSSSNGEALYKVCSSCHGANAEKAALGKSQVIKGWSADKIASALNGYKVGTYGGTMKSVMIGQVSKLSPEDVKALSEYISKL